MTLFSLDEYNYNLPRELIAQRPPEKRDSSRMMVLNRRDSTLINDRFINLPGYLECGDLLVFNNSRVIPARLIGTVSGSVAEAEILLLHRLEGGNWQAMVRPGRRLKAGAEVLFPHGVRARIEAIKESGLREVSFSSPRPFDQVLPLIGSAPLPPYIEDSDQDFGRYQTVYASADGSAAAPTAGFHFTDSTFEALTAAGIETAFITLHIGPGTFQPVKSGDIRDHRMHSEYYLLGADTAQALNLARSEGRRVIAVGTTACRVLESSIRMKGDGCFYETAGWTDLYIYPGFSFLALSALLTNFHLPRSSLLMLVSAFAGRDLVKRAYSEAVSERYRFFSFGDCMLIT